MSVRMNVLVTYPQKNRAMLKLLWLYWHIEQNRVLATLIMNMWSKLYSIVYPILSMSSDFIPYIVIPLVVPAAGVEPAQICLEDRGPIR